MRKLVLWIASRLAARYGCKIVHAGIFDEALCSVRLLNKYSYHSGHLTRSFKAGKAVQRITNFVADALGAAEAVSQ